MVDIDCNDFERNSIIQKIKEKKHLINLTSAMSGAPRSEGGISCEKANNTIMLFRKDISDLEKQLKKIKILNNEHVNEQHTIGVISPLMHQTPSIVVTSMRPVEKQKILHRNISININWSLKDMILFFFALIIFMTLILYLR